MRWLLLLLYQNVVWRPSDWANECDTHSFLYSFGVSGASHFRCNFIWFQLTISQINRMSTAISLSNSLSVGRLVLHTILNSVRRFCTHIFFYHALIHTQKCIQRTCFECLLLVLFHLCLVIFLVGWLADVCVCVSFALDNAFTFTLYQPRSLLRSLILFY